MGTPLSCGGAGSLNTTDDIEGRPQVPVAEARGSAQSWWHAHLRDILGIGWVVVAAGIAMAPALIHGIYLGPYDILSTEGLSFNPAASVHSSLPYDQITEFIPWTNLAWAQVHQGHLPLWNPYTALGVPLAFNLQSATFSLPSLLGYLGPLHLAYTVSVLSTLVIAGTGVYVLGRVMGLSAIGCAMAGTVFELSGSFMGWLGWPIASVLSWSGWLFAAIIVVCRGERRLRHVTFLALVVALVIYSGQIDMLVLLLLAVVVFVLVSLAVRARRSEATWPAVIDLLAGGVVGFGLAAPLALPGLQLAKASIRTTSVQNNELPLHIALNVIFQGFNGLPWSAGHYFDFTNYIEGSCYVGVIVLVLAAVAVVMRRSNPEVVGFAATAVVMAIVAFVSPLETALSHLPSGDGIQWHRALLPMCFALAVLAGVGVDVLARYRHRGAVRRLTWWGFVVGAIVLLVLWETARGTLPPQDAAIRNQSFIWPAVTTAVGLVVAAGLVLARPGARLGRFSDRSGRWAAAVLVTVESVFLITAAAPLWSSSSQPVTATPAEAALKATVGSSVVGYGTTSCVGLGIVQEFNVALGVHEFAAYDPLLPRTYFSSWTAVAGGSAGPPVDSFLPRSEFCPSITSVAVARRYGVKFVLEPVGTAGPMGAVFDKVVGGEDLYAIPGSALATFSPLGPGGAPPGPSAVGKPVRVVQPAPGSFTIVTDRAAAGVLRLRLTDVPGWHATIDGKRLTLERYSGVMLQANVPAGRHVITLHYWPSLFSMGLVLAGLSVAGLLVAAVVIRRSPRARRTGGGIPTVG